MEEDFKQKLSELQLEVDALRDQNKRLNKELRRYQIAMGSDAKKGPELPDESLPPWAYNAIYLSPLLMAYDNRIQELESALSRSRRELEELGEKSQRLTNENLTLREEMERRWREMLEKQKNDIEGTGISMAFFSEEKQEMQERLDLLSTENNMLLEQVEALKNNNDYLEKISRDREEACEKLAARVKQLSNEFNSLKLSDEQIRTHKEIAEEKLKKANEYLGRHEREREENITVINKLKNELRIAQQQAMHYRKAYEEVDLKKTQENEMLMQEAQNVLMKQREAENRTMVQERDLEDAREAASRFKRELESLKSEHEAALKVMDDLESKIALYKQKEDSYMKTASDAKIKVEEAYLERDRIALKEQQYVKQIERLQENLRVERNTQKIKIDELVESLRNQFKKIIDDREEEIKILRDKMNTLSLQCDRLTRENSSLKSEVERYESILQEEHKRLDARLTEYEKRFKEAEETRLSEKRLLEEQASSFSFQRQEWDTLRRTFEQRISLLTRDVENYNSTAMRSQEDAKRARSQLDDVLRERDALANELNLLRDSYYEKLQESATEFNHKIYSLEQQLTEAREKQRESESKSWELVKKQEKVSEKWREEVKQLYNYYERVVGELNDEIRRISSKGDAADLRQKLVV